MSKTVVLAEKPSVGRDIARVLGCSKKGNGFLEGSKHIVTWALGHLVTLADPEAYDVKYKQWKLDDLPMLPSDLELVVMKQTSRQFNAVKSQLNRSDVSDIVIATDAGREGELVARWILDKARVKKPIKRLWISSVTDKAISDGFKQLKPGKNYENLYTAAVARSEADWYVGLNATRALTTKYNAQLSSGRVQTPTLGIIAAREEDIRNFKPKTYFGLQANMPGNATYTFQDENNNSRIFSEEKINNIQSQITGKPLEITKVEKTAKKNFAPQLYDLTELQRDANRLFQFSGKQTLSIMQRLYERHKVLTYPRTDSRYLSSDIVPTLMDRLDACGVDQYAKPAGQILRKGIHKLPKSVVDNTKLSDHHAIIPTEEHVNLASFDDQERRIYDLVIKRFLAVLMDPHEFEQTTIHGKIANHAFSAQGKIVTHQGWKNVYDNQQQINETDDREITLPSVQVGNSFSNVTLKKTSGETKPPERLTEGTLLHAMENPARFMDPDERHLAGTLKKTGGIGTVATRADVIDKLFNNQYMESRGKYIHLTSKGKQLLELAPEELRSPALTAEWEQKLGQIENGQLNKNTFINEIKAYTKKIVQDIKADDTKFKHDNITGTKCPKCNKLMLEVNNRNGRMLVCQDRGCGHRRNIARKTNARCPNCRKRLELRGEGEGQTFTCPCGHREKLSTFNKRRQKEKKHNVSKGDINKYLNKQDDGFANNALAEQLAKLKKQ